MPDVPQVVIPELAQIRSDLRGFGSKFPRELAKAHKKVGEPLAQLAKEYANFYGGAAGLSASSIRSGGTQTYAYLRGGGSGYPFFFGGEFGGGKYGAGRPSPGGGYTTQFRTWKGNGGDAGYFMFPAVRHALPHAMATYADVLTSSLTATGAFAHA